MSFRFNFAADDSDSEELPTAPPAAAVPSPSFHPAQLHTLESLAVTLPRNISYSSIPINAATTLPRRELYDVRMQLMAADDLTSPETLADLGLGDSDLRKTVYEGGLKSWECSVDLAAHLDGAAAAGAPETILELGCGTALPSLYIFRRLLERDTPTPVVLTLADYNASVLQLVTLPNLFLTWVLTTQPYLPAEGDIDTTPALVEKFIEDTVARGVHLRFCSGGWGREMVGLLGEGAYDLVLASETVYQPETIPWFVDTMCSVLKEGGKALVAAKRLYFGVGGGVEEFLRSLEAQTGWRSVIVAQAGDEGVGRLVLEVKR